MISRASACCFCLYFFFPLFFPLFFCSFSFLFRPRQVTKGRINIVTSRTASTTHSNDRAGQLEQSRCHRCTRTGTSNQTYFSKSLQSGQKRLSNGNTPPIGFGRKFKSCSVYDRDLLLGQVLEFAANKGEPCLQSTKRTLESVLLVQRNVAHQLERESQLY